MRPPGHSRVAVSSRGSGCSARRCRRLVVAGRVDHGGTGRHQRRGGRHHRQLVDQVGYVGGVGERWGRRLRRALGRLCCRRRRRRRWSGALGRDGDAEGADGEVLIGLQQHQRPRRKGVALAAGVLDQVLGQLVSHLRLVGGELLAIRRIQEHRVLVRHVDAVDRDRLVVVHLLGQLARQLRPAARWNGRCGKTRPRRGRRSCARCYEGRSAVWIPVAGYCARGGRLPAQPDSGGSKRRGGWQYSHERGRSPPQVRGPRGGWQAWPAGRP